MTSLNEPDERGEAPNQLLPLASQRSSPKSLSRAVSRGLTRNRNNSQGRIHGRVPSHNRSAFFGDGMRVSLFPDAHTQSPAGDTGLEALERAPAPRSSTAHAAASSVSVQRVGSSLRRVRQNDGGASVSRAGTMQGASVSRADTGAGASFIRARRGHDDSFFR